MTQPIDVAAALERRRRQEQTQSDAEMDAIAAELQAAIPTDLSGLAARARVLVRWLRHSPSADEDVQGLAKSLAEGLAALLKGATPPPEPAQARHDERPSFGAAVSFGAARRARRAGLDEGWASRATNLAIGAERASWGSLGALGRNRSCAALGRPSDPRRKLPLLTPRHPGRRQGAGAS